MTNTQLSPQSQATTTMRAAWYERKGAAQDVIEYGEMVQVYLVAFPFLFFVSYTVDLDRGN